jgi:hypothetical protein
MSGLVSGWKGGKEKNVPVNFRDIQRMPSPGCSHILPNRNFKVPDHRNLPVSALHEIAMSKRITLARVISFVLAASALTGPMLFAQDSPEKNKAGDSIEASIVGRLTTKWDARTLFYASAHAGGTEIELDPVGCDRITSELLDFINTQGGGVITDYQVEANGFLVFERRPKTTRYRGISRDDPNAVVPVLKVRWIKITTLPSGKDVGSIKRNRDRVESTVVGVKK